jgi:predicted nuclease with TOPRIM domain
VDRLKTSKAKLNAQVEAQKAEVEDLKKKLTKMNENFDVVKAKLEISEMERVGVQKNSEELRDSKVKCYEVSMECVKKLKDSFGKVGSYSSEQKFIRGDPEGVIQWIGEEAEAFDEIISDRGDFCAFVGARGAMTILEKAGCEHVKVVAQARIYSLS